MLSRSRRTRDKGSKRVAVTQTLSMLPYKSMAVSMNYCFRKELRAQLNNDKESFLSLLGGKNSFLLYKLSSSTLLNKNLFRHQSSSRGKIFNLKTNRVLYSTYPIKSETLVSLPEVKIHAVK